jgi:hypothetical protein
LTLEAAEQWLMNPTMTALYSGAPAGVGRTRADEETVWHDEARAKMGERALDASLQIEN